jgi:hypothetical protein
MVNEGRESQGLGPQVSDLNLIFRARNADTKKT